MEQVDNWEKKDVEMICANCISYINFRCRKHAPTTSGFVPVYPSDWCGDHRLSKDTMKILNANKIAHEINLTGK
jgi:hypothetical protein